jgi:exosortase
MTLPTKTDRRAWIGLAVWLLAITALFAKPVIEWVRVAFSDDNASHTLLIPLIVAWLLYSERDRIFAQPSRDLKAGTLFAVAGMTVSALAYYLGHRLDPRDSVSFYMLGLLLFFLAGFCFAFGIQVLRKGAFPFAFLFLLIPFPTFVLGPVISWLQQGSAEIAAAIFNISGVPVLREGLVFHLSRTSIEVAPECSGIRSSMALIVLALLVAHFAFHPVWKKVAFVAAGLLMMIIKNGVRIATLTLLANYVNPQFLYGNLHRQGGVVFFLLGLVLLLPVYWLLKRGERSTSDSPRAVPEFSTRSGAV